MKKRGACKDIELTNGKQEESALTDGLSFIAYGAQAIANDEFSKCFAPKPRNKIISYLLKGLRAPVSIAGMGVRYFILLPIRYAVFDCRVFILLGASAAFFVALPIVLRIKSERLKRLLFKLYCKAFLWSWGSKIRYHGKKPDLDEPHIFVSNHTSIIDYIVLSAYGFPHATVAQKQGGIIGYFQKHILNLNGSLNFDRSQKHDRSVIAHKMREHVFNTDKSPLLIFPEGTCVNNEYTVLFQKGAFELGAKVAPVAIKYNKSWADAYWHSRTQTFSYHLFYLMTRWRLVADVWFLEPRAKRENQTAIDFANEVKAEISSTAGLKNLSWDGYWKNYVPPKEKQEKLKDISRQRYSKILLNRLSKPSPVIQRRNSMSDCLASPGLDFEEPAWMTHSNENTNIRNEVLVALQGQERQHSLISMITDQRHNVIDTWKEFAKKRIGEDNIGSKRIENLSWRLWFKDKILNKPTESNIPKNTSLSDLFELVTSFLPLPLRLYSPDDVYSKDLSSMETLTNDGSPRSPRRIKFDFDSDSD
ncbi:hypothetical protein HDV01_005676 [Terramyces sp. JEL0728]|nr:hypothetical protein HDV01_005676 [Terramyces sp. JEL0728]